MGEARSSEGPGREDFWEERVASLLHLNRALVGGTKVTTRKVHLCLSFEEPLQIRLKSQIINEEKFLLQFRK